MAFEKFMFEWEGKEYFIPHATQIPSGLIRKARKLDQTDGAFTVLEQVLGEDSPEMAALDAMPISQLGEVLKAWQQGASLGESQGSST